ncbi:MAG: hypothetical protein DMF51_09720 [Acidobacteria bacterium]|nr:MAG: hypothetical protein DMF51_09720 [Acidobacteriota bacterium]
MRFLHGLTLTGMATLCLCCADSKPASIAFTAPPPLIVSGKIIRLEASVANKKGEPIGGQAVTCTAAPADVVEVVSGGGLRCLKTGDATVTLAGGGLSTPVAVKCRIPTEVEVPQELQLVLGSAPAPLHARVLGEGGRELKDVPVQLSSSDESIVAVVGDKMKPVALGRARLRAAVEEIAGVTAVEVDERIVSEPLRLADGARRSFKLQPGDYLVSVDVQADFKAPQGVTVTWEGAACEGQPERQSHRVRCRVNEPATVTVANPKQFGLGAGMTGSLAIYRVPSQ